jgi:DNA-binding NarL/FixJ family response regulator
MNHSIRILLVDDQPTVRHGLRLHLSCEADIAIAGEAGDGDTAIEMTRSLQPDVVVLDISMPGMDGYEAARRIRAMGNVSIVMLSLRDDPACRAKAADAGADAFVSKHEPADQLTAAIRTVTRRQ